MRPWLIAPNPQRGERLSNIELPPPIPTWSRQQRGETTSQAAHTFGNPPTRWRTPRHRHPQRSSTDARVQHRSKRARHPSPPFTPSCHATLTRGRPARRTQGNKSFPCVHASAVPQARPLTDAYTAAAHRPLWRHGFNTVVDNGASCRQIGHGLRRAPPLPPSHASGAQGPARGQQRRRLSCGQEGVGRVQGRTSSGRKRASLRSGPSHAMHTPPVCHAPPQAAASHNIVRAPFTVRSPEHSALLPGLPSSCRRRQRLIRPDPFAPPSDAMHRASGAGQRLRALLARPHPRGGRRAALLSGRRVCNGLHACVVPRGTRPRAGGGSGIPPSPQPARPHSTNRRGRRASSARALRRASARCRVAHQARRAAFGGKAAGAPTHPRSAPVPGALPSRARTVVWRLRRPRRRRASGMCGHQHRGPGAVRAPCRAPHSAAPPHVMQGKGAPHASLWNSACEPGRRGRLPVQASAGATIARGTHGPASEAKVDAEPLQCRDGSAVIRRATRARVASTSTAPVVVPIWCRTVLVLSELRDERVVKLSLISYEWYDGCVGVQQLDRWGERGGGAFHLGRPMSCL